MMIKAEEVVTIGMQSIIEYYGLSCKDCKLNDKTIINEVVQLVRRKIKIDAEQWELEDTIRAKYEKHSEAIEIKKRIDKSNQKRTKIIEQIDEYIRKELSDVKTMSGARKATETPGLAIDRLCIMLIRKHHIEVRRALSPKGSKEEEEMSRRLTIVTQQIEFLSDAIDCLLRDLEQGKVECSWVRQMKMYANEKTETNIINH